MGDIIEVEFHGPSDHGQLVDGIGGSGVVRGMCFALVPALASWAGIVWLIVRLLRG